MPPFEILIKSGVYALMAVCLAGALLSVLFRNLFHASLALTAALLSVAGIYLALHADFLAMIQILIYIGAIMTLIVFAIMLTENFGAKTTRTPSPQSWAALAGGVCFLGFLVRMIHITPWPIQHHAASPVTVMTLGQQLLGTYVFPFEIVSIVLIAALIGAIVVARKDLNS